MEMRAAGRLGGAEIENRVLFTSCCQAGEVDGRIGEWQVKPRMEIHTLAKPGHHRPPRPHPRVSVIYGAVPPGHLPFRNRHGNMPETSENVPETSREMPRSFGSLLVGLFSDWV
jgi:hypothetical protein